MKLLGKLVDALLTATAAFVLVGACAVVVITVIAASKLLF
jgi:hypothetical protein